MDYKQQLIELYAAQQNLQPDVYLHAHSRNQAVVQRQISIFKRLSNFIPTSGTFLDWGCHHAPDACLVKMLRGDAVKLYGCDVGAGNYKAFYDFCDLKYSEITHPYKIPYEDNTFDAVMGSGVLEHVPLDWESLKELYRIIKPGGVFIMTMLPNWSSYTEWLNRTLKNPHHLRRYSLTEAKHMFMHSGFRPVASGYHQVIPSLSSTVSGIFDSSIVNSTVEVLFSQNDFLERIWPIRCFATNVFVVGKKELAFHG